MSRGFTLLEIIATLSVMAALVTVVAINAVKTRERHLLQATGDQVISHIKEAQKLSVAAAPINTASPPFGIEVTTNRLSILDNTGTTVKQYNLPANIRFANSASLIFATRTGLPSNTNSLRLESNNFYLTVEITQNGQVSLSPVENKT